jgi:hypothetical protein
MLTYADVSKRACRECAAGMPRGLSAEKPHTSKLRSRCVSYLSIRQHTSAYVGIRRHTSAYVGIRRHTSAYVSIRRHTSAYVGIRQHTSAYVSIRQHTSACVSDSDSFCIYTDGLESLRQAQLATEVQWKSLYEGGKAIKAYVCWRMLTYADVC